MVLVMCPNLLSTQARAALRHTLPIGALLMTLTTLAQPPNPDLHAVQAPLRSYIQAHETGNGAHIRAAFTADARITGHLGGKLINWGVDEYAARFSGQAAADEAQRRRSFEVLDLVGDAAVAKVVLDYPTVSFADHMSLLKINGQWKIVSKSFHAAMK
jgi:hypothetical protein